MFIGSRIRLFNIPDPNCLHPGSRILIKEFKYINPKKAKKWFLNSEKYDPGCSSRIPDPDADFLPSRIPDPGVKKAPNPGSRIRIRNTVPYMYYIYTFLPPFSFCLSLNFINFKLTVCIDCQNGLVKFLNNSFLYSQYVLSFYEYCVQCTYRTLTIFFRSYNMYRYMRTTSR
jgi:hypothetical protein